MKKTKIKATYSELCAQLRLEGPRKLSRLLSNGMVLTVSLYEGQDSLTLPDKNYYNCVDLAREIESGNQIVGKDCTALLY